jgi:8-oxo-dGTP diphosphatase
MGDAKQLSRPMHILLENINKFHQHIDFVYYAKSSTFEFSSNDGETDDLKWFTASEIQQLTGCPQNTKLLCLEAIELLGSN